MPCVPHACTPSHRFGEFLQDDRFDGEERWQAIGYVPGSVLLLLTVVHTWNERNQVVRIISARHASNAERKTYDEASL
jgi:uncharacterized DUF497 family protein